MENAQTHVSNSRASSTTLSLNSYHTPQEWEEWTRLFSNSLLCMSLPLLRCAPAFDRTLFWCRSTRLDLSSKTHAGAIFGARRNKSSLVSTLDKRNLMFGTTSDSLSDQLLGMMSCSILPPGNFCQSWQVAPVLKVAVARSTYCFSEVEKESLRNIQTGLWVPKDPKLRVSNSSKLVCSRRRLQLFEV